MKKSMRTIIVVSLIILSAIIYFVSSYMESADTSDAGSEIQTMFFATAGIVYVPLGIWILNKTHNKTPYVIAILFSAFLIGLYIASRKINLPLVGMQTDVGAIDVATKIIQIGIIVISVILLRDLKKNKVIQGS